MNGGTTDLRHLAEINGEMLEGDTLLTWEIARTRITSGYRATLGCTPRSADLGHGLPEREANGSGGVRSRLIFATRASV